MNKSKKGYNGTSKARDRRERVVVRLEAQLKSGKKPLESARLQVGPRVMEDLTEKDKIRITKELETLKNRT